MAKSITPRLGASRWSAGSDTVSRVDFDRMSENFESRAFVYSQGPLAARPAAGTSGRYYFVTNDADVSNNNRTFYDDGSQWYAPRYLQNGIAEASVGASVPLTARGRSDQSTDIFRVESQSSENVLFRVTPTGAASTQASSGLNGSTGVYLGRDANHDASLVAVSVSPTKPTMVLLAASGQSANLFSVRNSSGAEIASINPTGNAFFAGQVVANSLKANTLEVPNLSSNTSSSFTNAIFTTANGGSVPLSISGAINQTANLQEYKDVNGNLLSRITSVGGFATGGRISVGLDYNVNTALTGPILTVANTLSGSVPAAQIKAFPGQAGGNIFEVVSSTNTARFSVDASGNTIQSGAGSQPSLVVGNTVRPTTFFSGVQPVFEVQTGYNTTTYDENVVFRHAGNDSSAVSRKLTLQFKLGTEASSGESAKWVGIGAYSGQASANNSNLIFYTGGIEAGRFDSAQNLSVGNDITMGGNGALRMGGGNRPQLFFTVSETHTMGIQSNTTYSRGGNFAWFAGGTHSDTKFDPGTGGSVLATLTSGTDTRFTTNKLTLTEATSVVDTQPGFMIASKADTTRMVMSTQSIVSFTNSNRNAYNNFNINTDPDGGGYVNISNVAGGVNLYGQANAVNFFSVSGHNLFIQATTPVANVNENDIWINITGAGKVNIRKSGVWVAIG